MWKKKYEELMFPIDQSTKDTLEGEKLKLEEMPLLYKYTKIDEYSLANLTNDTTWFRNAAGFNDPYDSSLSIGNRTFYDTKYSVVLAEELSKVFQSSPDELSETISSYSIDILGEKLLEKHSLVGQSVEVFRERFESYIKETDELLEKYSVDIADLYQNSVYATCFSEDPKSMLMWSHYADNHKGMVLEYDFINSGSKFKEAIRALHPVLYKKELLNLNDYLESQDEVDVPVLAAISKLDTWSYEKEWRMLTLDKSVEGGKVIKLMRPKSIILGANVEQIHKIMISLDAKKLGIPVKQIKLGSTKYDLSIVDFTFQ